MNYDVLFGGLPGAEVPIAEVRIALSGANGQFARTLLAQCRSAAPVRPTVLCDLDVAGLQDTCRQLGYAEDGVVACTGADDVVTATASGRVALVADPSLLDPRAFDVLVEATGHVGAGYRMALAALRAGRHVALVSKETESVVGPALARVAADHGVVCTTAEGDQPANLVSLITWARLIGLEVVAAGKSAEYDVVHDPATGAATHLDHTVHAPALGDRWHLGGDTAGTLAARRAAVEELRLSSAADHCEMNVVANATGLVPDVPGLHYPLVRTSELADVYALAEHGGIIGSSGVLDVFTQLRRPDEASFGGGVFVVVRCDDEVSWEVLAAKGHVVSADRRYACIYHPYHLMGVETVLTVLSAAVHGRTSGGREPRTAATMVARATRALRAGEALTVTGHHHEIDGVEPLLLPAGAAGDAAPYYLAGGARLRRDVEPGELVALGALEGLDPEVLSAWRSTAPIASPAAPTA